MRTDAWARSAIIQISSHTCPDDNMMCPPSRPRPAQEGPTRNPRGAGTAGLFGERWKWADAEDQAEGCADDDDEEAAAGGDGSVFRGKLAGKGWDHTGTHAAAWDADLPEGWEKYERGLLRPPTARTSPESSGCSRP